MAGNSPECIYLDHNATTPIFPEVVDAMRACWSAPYLNPASQHELGRRARRVLEDARDRIGELLGAEPSDRVVFTSGGTESNNLAVPGLLHTNNADVSRASLHPHVIISPLEHPSIASLADVLELEDTHVSRLGVDSCGVVRGGDLTDGVRPETRVVAVMRANNETGVLQPVAELAAICNERGVPLHTDAAQVAGKLPLNFRELGAATMTIAAHKFGGPVGVGALIVRGDIDLAPLLHGGVQQYGLRPGTESVALAVGMCQALELWNANRRNWLAHMQTVRDRFETALAPCEPVIIGQRADRLANTSNVAFRGLDRQQLFLALDQAGVACSTGSACASGSSEPSPVHLAMGLDSAVISSALRFSFGVATTVSETEEAAARIIRVCNNLRRQK